jgi:hypothetical protein
MRPDNAATDIIPTLTGTVGSQAPYQQVTVTVHLLKTQGLSDSYKSALPPIPRWASGDHP